MQGQSSFYPNPLRRVKDLELGMHNLTFSVAPPILYIFHVTSA